MTDEPLTGLFADGTAPARDAAFARRVDARIGRARRGLRLRALATRALVVLILAATVLVTIRALSPALERIAEISPQFMGVPAPLILVVLGAGIAMRAGRFVRLRFG